MELRVIFMGTADLACSSLRALVAQKEWAVISVVTQPDRPKGRNLALQFSPVKKTALAANIPLLQPERAKEPAFLDELTRLQPDLIVVAAYGQILPKTILELPRFGCLNVHTSLLPKYRGAAPIQWAILEDEQETGVTIMKMDAGLDTGDILTQAATPIRAEDNAQTLHDRLAEMGADLLVRTVPDFVSGRIIPQPQPLEGATYARKISREDGRLDWRQPARSLWNKVRAFTPWPGAYTHFGSAGVLLKIWEAAVAEEVSGAVGQIVQADKNGLVLRCGHGGLQLLQVQKEGGRRMSSQEFLAGHPLKPGDVFS
jgi:methionyl-tRNA formyltransferase